MTAAGIPDTGAGGTVILLNGASSAGKTTIARALLDVLDGRWFHLPIDAFHAMRADRDIPDDELQAEIDRTAKGFHRAVAGMAAAGNNVVADYLLTDPWRRLDLLELLVPEATVLVAVYCPLPELRRRERARGDREPGLAARQYHQVHADGVHDLLVDTSVQDARACAEKIRDVVTRRPRPTAFERLRELRVDAAAGRT